MDEAQFLADRVAVMVDGEIVASGPPEALGGRDELPTEIRFVLPDGVGIGELPAPARRRGRAHDRGERADHDVRRHRRHPRAHRLGAASADRR